MLEEVQECVGGVFPRSARILQMDLKSLYADMTELRRMLQTLGGLTEVNDRTLSERLYEDATLRSHRQRGASCILTGPEVASSLPLFG